MLSLRQAKLSDSGEGKQEANIKIQRTGAEVLEESARKLPAADLER
jgi:hypothetical protein